MGMGVVLPVTFANLGENYRMVTLLNGQLVYSGLTKKTATLSVLGATCLSTENNTSMGKLWTTSTAQGQPKN